MGINVTVSPSLIGPYGVDKAKILRSLSAAQLIWQESQPKKMELEVRQKLREAPESQRACSRKWVREWLAGRENRMGGMK